MTNAIWVYDQNFNKIGSIQTYVTLNWTEEYQNRGVFTLIVYDTQYNIDLLQEEYFLYMTDKKTAMVIKYRNFDSEKQIITINGYTTLELLDQRFLLGYKTIVNAEQGMREMVSANLRGFPNLTQTDSNNYADIFNAQYSNALFIEQEILPEICAATDLGIRMFFDHDNKKHVFDVYKGIDHTFEQTENPSILFGDDFGNLASTIIVSDNSVFKNVAYVFGAGEGEERIMVEVGTATGRDRYELPVDARDLQQQKNQTLAEYKEVLKARGIAKLNERNKRVSFQAEVDGKDFGNKYDLGDLVTCKSSRYGIQFNTRIMQFSHKIENNIPKIILTLGQPEITIIGEMKLWLR